VEVWSCGSANESEGRGVVVLSVPKGYDCVSIGYANSGINSCPSDMSVSCHVQGAAMQGSPQVFVEEFDSPHCHARDRVDLLEQRIDSTRTVCIDAVYVATRLTSDLGTRELVRISGADTSKNRRETPSSTS
jgi:hypothetical protein